MKFVALVSGGKDSIYSIQLATLAQHHELIACIHLGAPPNDNDPNDDDAEESYMYQSAGSNMVKYQVEQCLNVPCLVYPRKGRSIQTGLLYRPSCSGRDHDRMDNTSIDRDGDDDDEVEDLHRALLLAKQMYPMIEAVCSGAILSNYQRNRIEQIVCNTLQWHSLSYLWRKANPQQLLQEMIHDGQISAILVKTASPPGLRPRQHLNRTIRDLYSDLLVLRQKYQFQICGEGGEYESFVLNAKIFKQEFIVDEWNIQTDPQEEMIGTLQVTKYHTAEKLPPNESRRLPQPETTMTTTTTTAVDDTSTMTASVAVKSDHSRRRRQLCHPMFLPPHNPSPTLPPTTIRQVNGGLYSISELTSPQKQQGHTNDKVDDTATSSMIQEEIHDILQLLQTCLDSIHCTPQDILMVHVYVAHISYFSILNEGYRNFFGIILPPSRSTVDVGAILGPNKTAHIMIDCFVQCGSGAYMRDYNYSTNMNRNNSDIAPIAYNTTTAVTPASVTTWYAKAALQNTFAKLRDVLHVQSRSYWAPVCVGPYSQANTLRGVIHFCAGQIGLYPPTMQFQTNVWTEQLRQAWKNLANVLDALDACGIPKNLMSCVLFMSDTEFQFNHENSDGSEESEWTQLCDICKAEMSCNANVIPGDIDGLTLDSSHAQDDDEYEDEETRIEDEKNCIPTLLDENDTNESTTLCPVLVVSIPKMPVGALCEIEVVAASRRATNALQINDYMHTNKAGRSTLSVLPPVEVTETSQEQRHQLGWDTGHDIFQRNEPPSEPKANGKLSSVSSPPQSDDATTTIVGHNSTEFHIQSYFRCLG